MKSRTRRAVVFGSTVTGLSSGTGGGFTLAYSVVISPAKTGAEMAARTALAQHSGVNRLMKSSLRYCPRSSPQP
jgi:hypothetical protein